MTEIAGDWEECSICGNETNLNELVDFGDNKVCGICKPDYVQRLSEGLPVRGAALSEIASRLAERELGFSELLSESISVFSKRWQSILACLLVFSVPLCIIKMIVNGVTYTSGNPLFQMALTPVALVFALLSFISTGALIKIVAAETQEVPMELSWREALSQSSSIFGKMFGSAFLSGLLLILWTLLLIIPGVIMAIYYMFVFQAVVLADKSGMDAINFSKSLVKGRFWKVAWCIFAVSVIFGIAALVISMPVGILGVFSPKFQIVQPVTEVIAGFLQVVPMIFATVMFLNLRCVGETE